MTGRFFTRTPNLSFFRFQEFFSSSGVGVPEVEGPLYIKSDSKKGWKKHQCVLRASGLYYYPKEKAKVSSRDLVCLATFDVNQVSSYGRPSPPYGGWVGSPGWRRARRVCPCRARAAPGCCR